MPLRISTRIRTRIIILLIFGFTISWVVMFVFEETDPSIQKSEQIIPINIIDEINDKSTLTHSSWNESKAQKGKTLHKNQPNILFIIADDFGFNDVGYNSDDALTPNIDSLSKKGIILHSHYTLCVCSASRGVLLSGRRDIENGLRGIITKTSTSGLDPKLPLLSNILRTYSGYDTYAVGKWHIGYSSYRLTPTFRGFEYFYGMYGGSAGYYDHRNGHRYDLNEESHFECGENCSRPVIEDDGTYSTYLFTDKVIEIIKNHSDKYGIHYQYNAKKNKFEPIVTDERSPFFIYLSYQAIHSPPVVPAQYLEKVNDTYMSPKRRTGLAMIYCMDEGIGNITKLLKDKGLYDNTIIIFTSDNGAAIAATDGVGGENYPLRGGKHSIWEGGTRVPAVLHYGGFDSKYTLNYQYLFHISDWMPTLMEMSGLSLPQFKYLNLSGVSHYKVWSEMFTENVKNTNSIYQQIYDTDYDGKLLHKPPRDLIWYSADVALNGATPGSQKAIRWKNYKMLMTGGGRPSLWYRWNTNDSTIFVRTASVPKGVIIGDAKINSVYDLKKDPFERYDLNAKNAFKNRSAPIFKWLSELNRGIMQKSRARYSVPCSGGRKTPRHPNLTKPYNEYFRPWCP